MMRWRPLTTLVAATAAGALVWFVPHFDRTSTSGYWAAMAFFAAAGLVLGIAQLHGRDGNPRAMFLVVFVPVLIAAVWILIGAQPGENWFARHVRSWSDDMGIAHAVHNLGEHAWGARLRRRPRLRAHVRAQNDSPPPHGCDSRGRAAPSALDRGHGHHSCRRAGRGRRGGGRRGAGATDGAHRDDRCNGDDSALARALEAGMPGPRELRRRGVRGHSAGKGNPRWATRTRMHPPLNVSSGRACSERWWKRFDRRASPGRSRCGWS